MATVYVDWTLGDDSRTYAQAQNSATPWKTPGKVNTSAVSGDTAVFAAGTYTLASITFSKVFTFIGASPVSGSNTVILDAGGSAVNWSIQGSGTFTITNFTFQNSHAVASSGLIETNYNSNPTLVLNGCVFRDITLNTTKGAVISSSSASSIHYLNNCVFNDVYCSNTGLSSGIISQYDRGGTSWYVTGCTVYIGSHSPYNVTYFYYTDSRITVAFVIKNTIFRSIPGNSLRQNGTVTTETATYSCFNGVTGAVAGSGNITSDPLFIDAANNNFRLRPTSPCINAGVVI